MSTDIRSLEEFFEKNDYDFILYLSRVLKLERSVCLDMYNTSIEDLKIKYDKRLGKGTKSSDLISNFFSWNLAYNWHDVHRTWIDFLWKNHFPKTIPVTTSGNGLKIGTEISVFRQIKDNNFIIGPSDDLIQFNASMV